MKKSLIIVGFAFVFLLTMSVVSAGLFINGDVSKTVNAGSVPTSIEGGKTDATSDVNAFSRSSASGRSERVGQSQRVQGMGSSCPRGFLTVQAKDSAIGNCCQKATIESGKAGAENRGLLQRRMGNSDIVSGYPPCKVGGARPCMVRDGTILS